MAVVLVGLVSTQYGISCFRNAFADCISECPANPDCGALEDPTLVSAKKPWYSTIGTSGQQGHVNSTTQFLSCGCIYQGYINQMLTTVQCDQQASCATPDPVSATCSF